MSATAAATPIKHCADFAMEGSSKRPDEVLPTCPHMTVGVRSNMARGKTMRSATITLTGIATSLDTWSQASPPARKALLL
jgi:hypothetical protein